MDDTRTRDPRAGRPRPELPQSLAWLYDPPPEEPAPEREAFEPQADAEAEVPHDPEALPTLLPFSTPAEEPAPTPYGGPVRGLRSAFARLEGSRPEAAQTVAEPDAGELPADRHGTGSTGWDTPVVRPFAPPAPQPVPDEADEAYPEDPAHPEDREDEAAAPADVNAWYPPEEHLTGQAVPPWVVEPHDQPHDEAPDVIVAPRPEPGISLFEPVALDVPAEPPPNPSPLPAWNRPAPWPSLRSPEDSAGTGQDGPSLPLDDADDADGEADDPEAVAERLAAPVPMPVRPRLMSLVARPAPPPADPDQGEDIPAELDDALPAALQPAEPVTAPDDEQPEPPALPEPTAQMVPSAPVARPRLAGLLGRSAPEAPPVETAPEPEAQEPVAEPVAVVDSPPDDVAPADEAFDEPADPAAPDPVVDEPLDIPPRPDLADPALTPLWAAVRDALGQSPRHTEPAVDVRGLDQAGRRALARLLGVRAVRAATRVDLAELERIAHEVTGLPLALAAERFVPRTGRRARTQSRTAPVRAGQEWLDAHPELAALPWTETWLETVRRDLVGGDTGLTENEVIAALDVLDALTASAPGAGTGWRVRQELAAEAAGDEHALDEGSAVAGLVLRGLAASGGGVAPADAGGRRRLWARFGVLADLVSTTCAAVGVAPGGEEPGGRWRRAAEQGLPVHVTARDLRRSADAWVRVPDAWPAVLVVASPLVLAAVADRFPGQVAAVCTDGAPGPLTLDLLARLRAGGTDLRFLADFDQSGVALGTQLAGRFGATPWRMSAEVYRRAVRSDLPALVGRVPEVPWAPELAASMTRAGRSVPVEQLLDEVLADLGAGLATGSGADG